MQITPENLDALIKALNNLANNPPASSGATLIFWGICSVVGILALVWGLMSLRFSTVEETRATLTKISENMESIKLDQATMVGKLWTKEDLIRDINLVSENITAKKIEEHEKSCPIRIKCSRNANDKQN